MPFLWQLECILAVKDPGVGHYVYSSTEEATEEDCQVLDTILALVVNFMLPGAQQQEQQIEFLLILRDRILSLRVKSSIPHFFYNITVCVEKKWERRCL
ncbi:hypothetical protein Y1Q_0011092 [Alligator mississippiensis]|uniref:Uncharacterized protein n=1 Tax=Alligator mississippiensis TaxID=8496 RepID=A0A151MS59_ALLMI|nr:hypothetical protein Y1Q_0011092 [Alligator mississippiensis]